MSVELQPGESGALSLRRILQEQIAAALQALGKRPLTDDLVHAARKQLKMARATLRLLRPALGGTYHRSNATLRDAARPLSAVRDGRVMLDSLDKLSTRYGPPARAIHTEAFKRILNRERAALHTQVLKSRATLDPERKALEMLHRRASRWEVTGDWEVVGMGLKQVYADGRKALKRSVADSTPENLHDWRKQAKYLWHELQILEPLWPGLIGELADQVHKLGDYLGEDHDLFVLRGKISAHQEAFRNAAEQGALLALVDRCRQQLQAKALVLGRRLYEERPAAFEKRFREYWRIWRKAAA